MLKKSLYFTIFIITLLILMGATCMQGTSGKDRTKFHIVKDGKAQAVIVRQISMLDSKPINEFRNAIQRATGVMLPVVREADLKNYPDDHVRILFGQGPMIDSLKINTKSLDEESYRIVTVDNHLVFTGTTTDSFLWAVSHYLDHYLGVRWLWPGDVGLYVPEQDTIGLPQLDIIARPQMEHRSLRATNTSADTKRWLTHHMMGSRSTYQFGHAFTKWWDRYGKDHPEYFAQPPAGFAQKTPTMVKLDLSNEDIDDVIIQEWQAAGKPDNWNVSPNDGSGFCISDGCLAMDDPPNQSKEQIWRAYGELTTRYVKFWNRLIDKMRAIKPNVTLSSYAYSSYREPPKNGIKLNDGMVLGIVHTYRAYEQWQGWHDTGAKLFLRPNWWHSGAGAPNILLHETGDYFKFAHEHGMIGFDFDSIMGYWGTQGPNYYLMARLSVRPDLTVDDVIDEYASAFGQAAPVIKDYIAYWENFSTEVAYTVSAGNGVSINPDGLYETLVEKHGLPHSPLNGGWYILPYLYTDDVLEEARGFLDQAEQLAVNDNEYVQQRIAFLQDGLRELELTREVIRYGYEKTRPADATLEDFIQLREQLDAMREEFSKRHIIWVDAVKTNEERRNIPTHESRTSGWGQSSPPTSPGEDEFEGM